MCPAGTYQPDDVQSVCLECPSGFFCEGRSVPPVACPSGFFCPTSTQYATQFPCPAGTFGAQTGLQSLDACSPCSAGQFCNDTGLARPTGNCSAGYHCSIGSRFARPITGECPAGFYCPAGTPAPEPCPPGTFGQARRLQVASDCTPCPAGQFCDQPGATAPTGACSAGHHCVRGSPQASPTGQAYGDLCPLHHYCPAGATVPVACPAGTFAGSRGLGEAAECSLCDAGFFCNVAGGMARLPCSAGFYCPAGSSSGQQEACPVNTHCPSGSSEPRLCEDGLFSNVTRASACQVCPAGLQCMAGQAPVRCAAGRYCPAGTGAQGRLCPAGTFNGQEGMSEEQSCLACSGGQFCMEAGLAAPSGPCAAGYFCTQGVNTATPVAGVPWLTGQGGVCQIGRAHV